MSDLLLDLLEQNKICVDNSMSTERAIVGFGSITVHEDTVIHMMEGIIGLFGLNRLREEVMIFQTYLAQLENAGVHDAEIQLLAAPNNGIEIFVKYGEYFLENIILDTNDDELSAKIHSFLSKCCSTLQKEVSEDENTTDG